MGLFKKLFDNNEKKRARDKYVLGMKKTRESAFRSLRNMFRLKKQIDEELLMSIEDTFILADVGVETTMIFIDALKKEIKKNKISDPLIIQEIIIDKLIEIYLGSDPLDILINYREKAPTALLFVGVNGSGKTTSIAKMAYKIKNEGKSVLMVAADTFRAGAIDQLKIWAEKVKCPIVYKDQGADPSSVVFDGLRYAKKHNIDVVLIDTAGRLQNKVNLMKELEKIGRIIDKELPDAGHDTYLVIDATTGQNGLSQARIFNEIQKIKAIILTKLDGTAKGGIVLAIRNQLKIPIAFVGLGERLDDFEFFDIKDYLYGLFVDIFEEAENGTT